MVFDPEVGEAGVPRAPRAAARRRGQRAARPRARRALGAAARRCRAPAPPAPDAALLPRRAHARVRDRDDARRPTGQSTRGPSVETFTLLPSMQSLTLDVIMSAVFGVEAGARQEELKRRVRAMLDPVGSRAAILMMVVSGGRLGVTGRDGALPAPAPRGRRADLRRDRPRRAAADLDERTDVLSMLLLARDEEGEADDATPSCATSSSRCWSRGTRRPRRGWPGRSSSCCATPRCSNARSRPSRRTTRPTSTPW